MKLIIQIPCHNEEDTLAATLAQLPRSLPGIDTIESLVVDDGSSDATAAVAKTAGADHLLRNPERQGLARTFMRGLDECLRLGADVVVNTDGDNQYVGDAIADIVRPIVAGEADMVIGDRQVQRLDHFGPSKRWLSGLGSRVVGLAAGARVPDAASGFRAFSRAFALRLVVHSEFTYTHETIIQASRRSIATRFVPVGVRATTRPSRLARSTLAYISGSAITILRAYAMYAPMTVFMTLGILLALAGTGIAVRYLFFFFADGGAGHVQSLLLAVLLLVIGFLAAMLGVLADLVAGNRRLLEEIVWRVRSLETRPHADVIAPKSPDRAPPRRREASAPPEA
jgi:glycosyltransferase involved in cell wall biosynthesis